MCFALLYVGSDAIWEQAITAILGSLPRRLTRRLRPWTELLSAFGHSPQQSRPSTSPSPMPKLPWQLNFTASGKRNCLDWECNILSNAFFIFPAWLISFCTFFLIYPSLFGCFCKAMVDYDGMKVKTRANMEVLFFPLFLFDFFLLCLSIRIINEKDSLHSNCILLLFGEREREEGGQVHWGEDGLLMG